MLEVFKTITKASYISTLMINKKTSIKNKIVLTISYIAVVVPSFLVALLAIVYYYLGIEQLFSEKITNSINDTVKVASLYLQEHNSNIKTSALMAAGEIIKYLQEVKDFPEEMTRDFLDNKSKALGLSEIVLFQAQKNVNNEMSLKVLGKTSLTFSLLFEAIPHEALEEADKGIIMVKSSSTDKVQALLRLDLFMNNLFLGNLYLLVGRNIDSKIIEHLEQTQEQANKFLSTTNEIQSIRKKVISAFLILSGIFLIFSIWIAKKLATFILQPLEELSQAINNFKLGSDTAPKVLEKSKDDEINLLAKSFNKMIVTISNQHQDLIATKLLVEERNQFIEAMMVELSPGVIVLNKEGLLEMINLSALKILSLDETVLGQPYKKVLKGFEDIIKNSLKNQKLISQNLTLTREKTINLSVKSQVLTTKTDQKIIITLDDITALILGQRFKAWADIARRLAHEIKNPLTPIQLAVDSLEYKFLKEISDKEIFQKYITNINSRIEDIKKLLTEFVEFSGTPNLNMQAYDLSKLVNEVIFLQKHQWPKIKYQLVSDLASEDKVLCDKTYITQVITNLLKNSAEALDQLDKTNFQAQIKITLNKVNNGEKVIVLIEDNGIGINANVMEKIFEPYVTTKATGTGLGLPIVKKILEEHKSDFQIKNGEREGTIASFSLEIAKF
jgi:two-component system nitrogen regulation sensor histidine kinase NtrY